MASNDLTFDLVYGFLLDNGGKVRNREAVRYFRSYLTDPLTKDANRVKFKDFVNTLAHTKADGDEKILILKSKYLRSIDSGPLTPDISYSPQNDPRNSIGIPVSPTYAPEFSPTAQTSQSSPRPRQPPPYRPPPPVHSSTSSLDTISIGSVSSAGETPQAPPRRRESTRKKSSSGEISSKRSNSIDEITTPVTQDTPVDEVTPVKQMLRTDENGEKKTVSVKERTKEFNRLASVEDELSPRPPKSAEKEKAKGKSGADEEDAASVIQIEPKKCMEWYVTMSKGDYQELLRLANSEPRLVKKKDPFTAYSVLHWGAKYGNADIVKTFAGRYNLDVNSKTNGGYTPLHICAQFGHQTLFKLLIEVYKADTNIRDYSGRTAEYYLLTKEKQKAVPSITLRSEYATNRSMRHGKRKNKSFRHKTISGPIVHTTN